MGKKPLDPKKKAADSEETAMNPFDPSKGSLGNSSLNLSANEWVKQYWDARGNIQLREIVGNSMKQNTAATIREFAVEVIRYGQLQGTNEMAEIAAEKTPKGYMPDEHERFEIQRFGSKEFRDIINWYLSLNAKLFPQSTPHFQLHILGYERAFYPFWEKFVACHLNLDRGKFQIAKIQLLETAFKHLPIVGDLQHLDELTSTVCRIPSLAPWMDYIPQAIEISSVCPIVESFLSKEKWVSRKEVTKEVKAAINVQDSRSIARTLSAMENLWMLETMREGSETLFRKLW